MWFERHLAIFPIPGDLKWSAEYRCGSRSAQRLFRFVVAYEFFLLEADVQFSESSMYVRRRSPMCSVFERCYQLLETVRLERLTANDLDLVMARGQEPLG